MDVCELGNKSWVRLSIQLWQLTAIHWSKLFWLIFTLLQVSIKTHPLRTVCEWAYACKVWCREICTCYNLHKSFQTIQNVQTKGTLDRILNQGSCSRFYIFSDITSLRRWEKYSSIWLFGVILSGTSTLSFLLMHDYAFIDSDTSNDGFPCV